MHQKKSVEAGRGSWQPPFLFPRPNGNRTKLGPTKRYSMSNWPVGHSCFCVFFWYVLACKSIFFMVGMCTPCRVKCVCLCVFVCVCVCVCACVCDTRRMGMVSTGGRVYCVGGFDGNAPLDCVISLDPRTRFWVPTTSPPPLSPPPPHQHHHLLPLLSPHLP